VYINHRPQEVEVEVEVGEGVEVGATLLTLLCLDHNRKKSVKNCRP